MNINYSTLKEKIMIKFIMIFSLLIILGGSFSTLTVRIIDKEIKALNASRLTFLYNNIDHKEKYEYFLDVACTLTNCDSIYVQNKSRTGYLEYVKDKEDDKLKRVNGVVTFVELGEEYRRGLHKWMSLGDYKFVIKFPLKSMAWEHFLKIPFIQGLLILIATSLLFSILIVLVEVRYNAYKITRNKHAIYDKLRLELTESLHHELAGPISVVESNIRCFIRETIKCELTNNGLCSYFLDHKELEECKSCDFLTSTSHDRLNSTLIAIESMKSILGTMSQLKKMKYQKENLLVSVLLDSVAALNRINTYNVTTINILDKELMENYCIYGTLSDGILFNSLMTLINNSNEAGATQITISPKVKNDMMYLYIADNGSGILTRDGEIEKDPERIFNYGYSTKEGTGPKEGVFKKIIKSLTTIDISKVSSRGAGLAIARKFLRESDGDLTLESTSEHGTIFKISFPVMNKISKEI